MKWGTMVNFKELDKKQLKKMKENERVEYQLEALEYYGNLKDQLADFKDKEKIHSLLLNVARLNPTRIHKLNEMTLPFDEKNCIFSANHSNANDFMILAQLIKNHFFIMADYTMINDPIVDKLNQLNGCIYLDRKSKSSGKNAISQAIDGVDQGYHMLIFPESTWNLFDKRLMLPRKWGDIIIAQQTSRPIIPIGLVYNSNNCFVKFGEPFYVRPEDDIKKSSEELTHIMEKLRSDIINSSKYQLLYQEISYEEWLKKTIKSYRNFDVDYEMSVIRKTDDIDEKELERILTIGEQVHPVETFEKKLIYSKVNYRLKR